MPKYDPDRKKFNDAVRAHILAVLAGGTSRNEMCSVLGVTRQAISSYVIGRTTPKPHIIEKLLSRWPADLPFRSASFGAGAFARSLMRSERAPAQPSLFDALQTVSQDDLKIEVARAKGSGVELKVSIKIAG